MHVISLYPCICKYSKYPVGHPKVYVGADCPPDCLERERIMKCRVLPPRKLYNPVRSACVDTMNQGNCTHSDEERCVVGT